MRLLTPFLIATFLSTASVIALAQSAAPPPASLTGKFILQLQGKKIGSADYFLQSTETGWAGTTNFDFTLQAPISTTRQLTFTKDWQPLTETQAINIVQTTQSLSLTANASRSKLHFHAEASGQKLDSDFDLTPHTVVLPNFDPAGLQILLNMQAANPAKDGAYTCFIPSGQGTMLPCTLTQSAKGRGTIDGQPIEFIHWVLKLSSIDMDIWSTSDSALLEAAIAAQAVAYTRAGFTLTSQNAAEPSPSPDVSSSAASARPAPATAPPAYAVERELTFPSDGPSVPGTLTLPRDAQHPPIVVLVQGSGVQDRDETVGANKVFQQIAWGLAQRGIATLRYDRRPKFAPQNFARHFDLDHEVVIDAASALAYCSTLPEADPAEVFLLGHSLGAQLAPYIVQRRLAEKPNSVRGYILLAGVQTPIDQTILRQVAEFSKAQGESNPQVEEKLAKWRAVFAEVRDPKTPANQPVGDGLSIPAAYWRDWLARDPASVMRTLPVPALVLRGELDRNVIHEDFVALSAAATAPGSKSEEFPGLNHLFMPVKEEHADELQPGTIAPTVLDTIATWIKTRK